MNERTWFHESMVQKSVTKLKVREAFSEDLVLKLNQMSCCGGKWG